jgi:DNA-binding transcriptional regulator YdaS (Cro superfamily)
MNRTPATKRAIKASGGFAALARELGLTPQAVWLWDRVPPKWVLDVELISGVAKERLRPDLYPANDRRVTAARRVA